MSTILECKNLSKKYGRKQALDNITLSLESGRIIGLLGPNGSGKTTLIKLINGLLAPTGGKLFINGNTPGVESKKIVSYLPERTYLDETQKVSEAITLFEDFYEDFDRSRAISMLEKVNIDSNARIKTLSKGTKEKVQLILVMSRRAKLYCLDEPIAGVDPAARDYILSTIINNYEPDSTILISTHLISDVENILDEVVFIKNGHIVLKISRCIIPGGIQMLGKLFKYEWRSISKLLLPIHGFVLLFALLSRFYFTISGGTDALLNTDSTIIGTLTMLLIFALVIVISSIAIFTYI